LWIQKRVRKRGSGAAGHTGDGPPEIGLREILSVVFGDLPKPGIDIEQMIRLCADEVEEMGVDERMKVCGQSLGRVPR
jgi:hypothetical protein